MADKKEQTFVMLKPDALENRWEAQILHRYEEAGIFLAKAYLPRTLSRAQAEEFYREHEGKPFFEGLVNFMSSGPLVGLVFEGVDVVRRVRDLHGATDPAKAAPRTIRRDFRSAGGPRNTVHGSDSLESAEREIALFQKWFD